MNQKCLAGLLWILIMACGSKSSRIDINKESPASDHWNGHFADDSYSKRAEGYDWIGVITSMISDSTVHVKVRSRADQKKATCTFDIDALIVNDSTLIAQVNGVAVYFIVNEAYITIHTQSESDEALLQYFCSGGASLVGKYHRLEQFLDEQQIDKTIFLKNLSLQNVFFEIRSVQTDSTPVLTVTTAGLKNNNIPYSISLNDQLIVDAETEDLNLDGFPELLIYASTPKQNIPVQVIGFSVNRAKSMSMIEMPHWQEQMQAFKGYQGKDECRILEDRLVRRFPLAEKSKDGGILYRFITYKLVEGEAMRKFEIESIR